MLISTMDDEQRRHMVDTLERVIAAGIAFGIPPREIALGMVDMFATAAEATVADMVKLATEAGYDTAELLEAIQRTEDNT
jgi:hypothetical protein